MIHGQRGLFGSNTPKNSKIWVFFDQKTQIIPSVQEPVENGRVFYVTFMIQETFFTFLCVFEANSDEMDRN
jgi:hypothetical protein